MREDFKKFLEEVRRNPFLSLVIVAVFLAITSISALPAYRGHLFDIDPQKAGQYGDFIGGYFGPTLSLIAIFFVVITLRDQRETSSAERRSEEIEAFENRFYHLIELHRANVAEMRIRTQHENIPPIEARTVFVVILAELQTALEVTREVNGNRHLGLTPTQELQLAYYSIFFGIGNNSSAELLTALRSSGASLSDLEFDNFERRLKSSRRPTDAYFRFNGHQARLGHYYRHLFQAISFVDKQIIITDKYSYTKALRAQLSTHEQVLLLANSLTPLGWRWWTENLITNYELVKNIPAGMFERICGIEIDAIFDEAYWEYNNSVEKPDAINILDKVEK